MSSDDRFAVLAVLDRYASALDDRDWKLLDEVFAPDARFDSGEWSLEGRTKVVDAIRGYLDGCGPTQHLLGNYRVELAEESARARCYVRAFHVGSGERSDASYEMAGEYRDELRRGAEGWRIVHRSLHLLWERGTRDVLRPAP